MNKIEDLKKIKNLLEEGLISKEEFESLKSDIIGENFLSPNDIERENISSINPTLDLHSNIKTCPNCKISLPIYTKKCSHCGYSFASGIIKDININNTIDEIENSDFPDKHNHLIFKILTIIVLFIGGICFFLNKGNNINTVQNETENIAIDSTYNDSYEKNDTESVDSTTIYKSNDTTQSENNSNSETIEGYAFRDYSSKYNIPTEKSSINYSSNPIAKSYKTLITDAYNSGKIDFAGYYITVMISQSMGMMVGVIVDTRDGNVYDFPNFNNDISYESYCEIVDKEFDSRYNGKRLINYSNSNLLVARGCTNESLTYVFYSYDENKKEFLKIKNLETPILEACD